MLAAMSSDASRSSHLPPGRTRVTHNRLLGLQVLVTAAAAKPRVLIIDPDPEASAILATWLEHAGISTVSISDGDAGLVHALDTTPQAVVCELYVPCRGETCLTSVVKREPRLAGIPVIAYSAWALEKDVDWAKSQGVDEFFSKPSRLADVAAAIQRLVAISDGRAVQAG